MYDCSYGHVSYVQLPVVAADLRGLSETSRSALGVVRVQVLDINDNLPTFADPVSSTHTTHARAYTRTHTPMLHTHTHTHTTSCTSLISWSPIPSTLRTGRLSATISILESMQHSIISSSEKVRTCPHSELLKQSLKGPSEMRTTSLRNSLSVTNVYILLAM